MENSTLSFALTGVVPAVCDAEAGERRRSNLTVSQANPPTGNGSSTNSQSGEVVLDQTDSLHAKPSPAKHGFSVRKIRSVIVPWPFERSDSDGPAIAVSARTSLTEAPAYVLANTPHAMASVHRYVMYLERKSRRRT